MPRYDEQGEKYASGTTFEYDPKTKTVKVVPPRIFDTDPWGPGVPGPDLGTNEDKPEANYSDYLGMFGLPDDVKKKINQIFAQTSDVGQATALALGYIRGTKWYEQTYPGIKEAFAKGTVSNEAQYRELLNQQSQLYRQYYGRDVTSQEFASHLIEGVSTETLGRRFAGAAYVNANEGDIQYELGAFSEGRATDPELKALGEENAGLDTPLGQQLQKRLALAHQRMQNVFQGSLATPSLSLRGGRLAAPSLGTRDTPDIAA